MAAKFPRYFWAKSMFGQKYLVIGAERGIRRCAACACSFCGGFLLRCVTRNTVTHRNGHEIYNETFTERTFPGIFFLVKGGNLTNMENIHNFP